MSGRLFIAEKPSVAQAIAAALGITKRNNGYVECGADVVTFCVGHMMEMAEPDEYTPEDVPVSDKTGKKVWRAEDLPIIPHQWILKPKKELKDQIKVIQNLLKKATVVVHAGDPDREGQLLVDELLEHFSFRGTVLRYWSSAIDAVAVKRALSDLKPNQQFYAFGEAAAARSRADWLIGMNLSRAYTLAASRSGSRALLTVGRVQTPTLAIVVNRDRKIEGFKPVSYFKFDANFSHKKGNFRAVWKASDTQPGLDEEGRLIDAGIAEELAQKVSGSSGTITSFEKKPGKKGQPKVWSLANLQIAASAKHGLKADQVLAGCQALYETHKLTSYPRSDCGFLPESQHADAPDILAALKAVNPALSALIDKADPKIKSKTWDDSKITAHHGIIPTQHIGDVSKLTEVERLIYDMIVATYLAQFFPPQEFQNTIIGIEAAGEMFQARGKVIINPGWTIVTGKDDDGDAKKETDESQSLPNVGQGDPVSCSGVELKSDKTRPPSRFTDGTLVEVMVNIHKFVDDPAQKKALKDDDGIGTPATRDSIIKELKAKGYIEDKGKNIISTPLGRSIIDAYHPSVTSPALTALFERVLKQIEAGNVTVETFVSKQAALVAAEVARLGSAQVKVAGEQSKQPPLSKYKCPDCGSPLVRRPSKKKRGAYWWSCSGFPQCKSTFFDNKGRPDLTPKAKKIGA